VDIIFDILKNLYTFMHDSWSYFLFEWLDGAPHFLQIGSFGHWWATALQIIFWLGLYSGVAWIYFKVVGYPVRKIISHFHRYNAKVMPKWQIVLYVFIGIYCSTGTTIISIEEKIFDITPVLVMLPILIYYLIKAKWRFVYLPLFQIAVIVFWVGAIYLFFPVLFILCALSFIGVTVTGVFSETKYRCPMCGREFDGDGVCSRCHAEREAVL